MDSLKLENDKQTRIKGLFWFQMSVNQLLYLFLNSLFATFLRITVMWGG